MDGRFDGCYLYGMPFEARAEAEEARAFNRFDRYPPIYWRMRRHFWNRRWPFHHRHGW